jgi:hypothetical protein
MIPYCVLILSLFSYSALISMDLEEQKNDNRQLNSEEMADFIIKSFSTQEQDDEDNPIKPFLINNLENLKKSKKKKYTVLKKLIKASRSSDQKIKNSLQGHRTAGKLFTQSDSEHFNSIRSEQSSNETWTKIGIGTLGVQCCLIILYLAGALPPLLTNC